MDVDPVVKPIGDDPAEAFYSPLPFAGEMEGGVAGGPPPDPTPPDFVGFVPLLLPGGGV